MKPLGTIPAPVIGMLRKSLIVSAIFAVVLLPATSRALELKEYLAEVEQVNRDLAASRSQAEGVTKRVTPQATYDDPFIAAGPDEIPFKGMGYVIRYQVSQNIPFPGKLSNRGDAAEARAEAANRDVETLRREIALVTAQVFFQAYLNQESLKKNEKTRSYLNDAAQSAKIRYESGSGAHHEWLLATLELNLNRLERLRLEREEKHLLARLNELRNQPPETMVGALRHEFSAEPTVPTTTFATLLQSQPEAASFSLAARSAASERKAAKLGYFPDFMVQGMVMQSGMEEEPSNWGLMIGMNVPLFTARKQSQLAAAASADERAALAAQQSVINRLQTEWIDARQQLSTARDVVRLYRNSILPTTELAITASRAAYVAQTAPLAEYLSLLRISLTQELEFVAAQIDAEMAALRLKEFISSPPLQQFAPSTPTLFSGGSMGGSSMGGSGNAGMGKGMPTPQTRTPGKNTTPPSGGMKGM